MHHIEHVFELAKAYDRAEITREALQDEVHAFPLLVVESGVNALAEVFGNEAAAGFVVAAELPIACDHYGSWSIDGQDERVDDFPPE